MKKIMYGILILIGGVLIASNFNVDSSKLDHKKVSASGTACKWISESGYGYGPVYLEKANPNIKDPNSSTLYYDSTTGIQIFNLIPCNGYNVGVEMDANLLYIKEGTSYNEYTGYFGLQIQGGNYFTFMIYVDDGVLTKYGKGGVGNNYVVKNNINIDMTSEKNFFNKININAIGSSDMFRQQYSLFEDVPILNYETDGIYTCVCTEY